MNTLTMTWQERTANLETVLWPHTTDTNAAGTRTTSLAGPDPDRVLVISDGHTTDDVDRELAAGLALLTDRGLTVTRLLTSSRAPIHTALTSEFDASNADIVIVPLNSPGIRTPFHWRSRARDAVRDVLILQARLHPGARVLVLTIGRGGEAERGAQEVARALVAAARTENAERVQQVHIVAAPVADSEPVAARIHDILEHQRLQYDCPQRARALPQNERRRHVAVDALALVGAAPNERLERVIADMAILFHTRGAAITVLPQDHQWSAASSWLPRGATPLDRSFCIHTIRSGRPFIVEDAHQDPSLPDTEIRFYAGYPIYSIDGIRIGAVCVFDPDPRPADTVEIDLLREFAVLAERLLRRN